MITRVPSALLVQKVLEDGPATFSELVKRTGLPPSEVVWALDELRKKGMVMKEGYFFVLRRGRR